MRPELRWFSAAVVATFLAGYGLGVVTPRFWSPATSGESSEVARNRYLAELRARYSVSEGQVEQIDRVLEARERECREIAARGGDGRAVEQERIEALRRAEDRIARVLTGDQRRRFLSDSQVQIVTASAQIGASGSGPSDSPDPFDSTDR